MAQAVMLPSFAGGELSPSLYARVDLDKYHSGASLVSNFFVDYRGGVSNRPGTEYLAAFDATKTVRLIPFIVDRTQAYVIAIIGGATSPGSLQIFRAGNLVATIATAPWLATEIFDVAFVQSADVLTMVHPNYPPYNLSRTAIDTFTFAQIAFGSALQPPTPAPTMTSAASGSLYYFYCVTALNDDGDESLHSPADACQSKALDPTATTPVTIRLGWNASANATKYNIYKAGPVLSGDPVPTVFGYIGQTDVTSFTDNNIAPDFSRTPPDHRDPFSPGQITAIHVTAGGTGATAYDTLTITDSTGSGAFAFGTSVVGGGAMTGAVLTNTGINYTAPTATPAAGTGQTFSITVDHNNHYPSSVTYYQQRRCYAGALVSPDLIEMSKTGNYNNFDSTPAQLDSDAITVNIASREVNQITHMIPMSTGLVVFTRGNAFLLTGGGSGGPVTPTNIAATPQASTGAGRLPPIVINYNILFQQYEGTVIRDMTYQWQTSSYAGADRSLLSNHLFFGYDLVDWGWAAEPFRLVPVVRSDGLMLVMTYVPEQEVYGWAQWVTDGNFESVTVIPNQGYEDIYVVVRRVINNVEVLWLERFFKRTGLDCPEDGRFLDGAVQLAVADGPSTLKINSVVGNVLTATIQGLVPGIIPPVGGGGTSFVMEAKENLDPTRVAQVNGVGFPTTTVVDMEFPGNAFDPVSRSIYYPVLIAYSNDDSTLNSTGYTLWDGATSINPGGVFWQVPGSTHVGDAWTLNEDFTNAFDWWTARKNIDTGAVTFFTGFDPAKTVPVGIGPDQHGAHSDGTWRRMVADTGKAGNCYSLVDPRTQDYWVRVESCELYVFRTTDNYALAISPYQFPGYPIGQSAAGINPAAMTSDYVYGLSATDVSPFRAYRIDCIPRLNTSPEITADKKLSYAHYYSDETLMAHGSNGNALGWAVTADKSLFFFSVMNTPLGGGGGSIHLLKFTPPTSVTYPSFTGGGLADVTPWTYGSGNDPLVVAGWTGDYTMGNYGGSSRVAMMRLDAAANIVGALWVINKEENRITGSAGTNYADTRLNYTFYKEAGAVFATHVVRHGLWDANWNDVSLGSAVYAWTGAIRQINTYLDRHDYDFSASASYTARWFAFEVHPVSGGVVDATTTKVLLVKLTFDLAGGYTVTKVYSDDSWTSAYPAYATAIGGKPVIGGSMNRGPAYGIQVGPAPSFTGELYWGENQFSEIAYDSGVWDESSSSFWFSGQNPNFFKFDSTYTPRQAKGGNPPFLKLTLETLPATPTQCLDLGCAHGGITSKATVGGNTVITAVMDTLPETLPFSDQYPIYPAGAWGYGNYVTSITALHLVGMQVQVVVNGVPQGLTTVPPGGVINFSQTACNAYAGLPYCCHFATLRLDTGEPTIQGKRKFLPSATIRVRDSVGFEVGTTNFNATVQPKAEPGLYQPYVPGVAPQLFTGDVRVNLFAGWEKQGIITVKQCNPYPLTLLGIIPETTIGDTQR